MKPVGGARVRAVTRRSSYGLMVAIGAAVLVVGLLVPFIVADPVVSKTTTAAPPPILNAGTGSGGVSGATGTATDHASAASAAPGATLPAAGGTGAGGAAPSGGGSGTRTGAGTGNRTGTGTGGGGSGAPQGVTRTASDVGVTPTTITVGIPIPNTAEFGDVQGGVQFGQSFGNLQEQYQVPIDQINAEGGILGRKVVPVYKLYDPLKLDSMQAACIYLTEQEHVFAVLGGFYGNPILCVTQQHHTLMLADASENDDFYAESGGRYFSLAATKDRQLSDLVGSLVRGGQLKGKTIGILDQAGIDEIPVKRTLLPALNSAGYKVTYDAVISNDDSAAQSQIPLEVQKMEQAGVNTIIVTAGLLRATVFVQTATNQQYLPQYIVSDFASGATDVYTAAMPASFQGAIGFTAFRTGEARAGLPEAPGDAACRELYTQKTGHQIDRTSLEYVYAVQACGIVRLFAKGMQNAGVNPTRASMSQALQNLRSFEVPFGGPGGFGPGKFDAPNATREVGWHADCRCWIPITNFAPTS